MRLLELVDQLELIKFFFLHPDGWLAGTHGGGADVSKSNSF